MYHQTFSQNVFLKIVKGFVGTGDSNGSAILIIAALAMILSVVGIVVACKMKFCAEGTKNAGRGKRTAAIVAAGLFIITMIFAMATQAFAASNMAVMDSVTAILKSGTRTAKLQEVTFTSEQDGYLNEIYVVEEPGVNAQWTCKYNDKTIYSGAGDQIVAGAVHVTAGEAINLEWSVKFDSYKDMVDFDKEQIATFWYKVNEKHSCQTYEIQSNGEWDCVDCDTLRNKTNAAYITVLDKKGQPTSVISLTGENVASTPVGNGTVVKNGNNITYTNSGDAQTVVVRTTSAETQLEINAPNDTVKHYDTAGLVNIKSVAPSSFHEFADTETIKVKEGRIVLEEGSDVEKIHIESTDNEFKNIVVAMDPSVEQPTFSRDGVTLSAGEEKLVVELQYDTKNTQATETGYIWLTKNGIYEQTKVSDTKTGEKEYVNTSSKSSDVKTAAEEISNIYCGKRTSEGDIADVVTGEGTSKITVHFNSETRTFEAITEEVTTVTDEQKEEAIKAVINNASAKNEVKISKEGEDDQFMPLAMFRNKVNSGTDYAGYTVSLVKDVNLSNVSNWIPIGTSAHPFAGNFDGNNKTIKNLTIAGSTSEGVGLFGYVVNTTNAVEIKDLTLDNVDINANVKSVGALVGYATNAGKGISISGITVNGTVDGNDAVAGVIGKCYTTATIKSCTNNADVTANRNVAGIIGKAASGKTTCIQNCTNTGDIYSNGERDKDASKVATSGSNYYNYYYMAAGIAITNGTTWSNCAGNENSGTIRSDGADLQANVTDKKWTWKTFDYTYDLYQTIDNAKKYLVVCNDVRYETLKDALDDLDSNTNQTILVYGDSTLSDPVTIDNRNLYFVFMGNYTVSGTFKGTNTVITANNDGSAKGKLSLGEDTSVKVKEGTATLEGYVAKYNGYYFTKFENVFTQFPSDGITKYIFVYDNIEATSAIEGLNETINLGFTGNYTVSATFKGSANTIIKIMSTTTTKQGTLKIGKESTVKAYAKDTATLEGVVAKYGGYYYANLQSVYDDCFKETTAYTLDICADISEETVNKTGTMQINYNLNGHNVSCSINHPTAYLVIKGEGSMTLTGDTKIYKIAENSSNLTIKDGTYTYNGSKTHITNSGTLTIEGGTFNYIPDKDNASGYVGIYNSGTVTIKGGTFNYDSTKYPSRKFYDILKSSGTASVIGGTFNYNPSYVASGYTATQEGNVWTVSKVN